MKVNLDKNWPLIVVNSPKVAALEKGSTSHLPSSNLQRPFIRDNNSERPSDIFPGKGMFVDIYI
ncbi:MAG: hypothetical protein KKH68_14965 [Proteobacteria bacterium]|nr:hypothetical protein [Pseudomonadota bacterium]